MKQHNTKPKNNDFFKIFIKIMFAETLTYISAYASSIGRDVARAEENVGSNKILESQFKETFQLIDNRAKKHTATRMNHVDMKVYTGSPLTPTHEA